MSDPTLGQSLGSIAFILLKNKRKEMGEIVASPVTSVSSAITSSS